MDWLRRSFFTVVAERAIKTVVFEDSAFIVDVSSRAAGSRLDRAKWAEMAFGAFLSDGSHRFLWAVRAFVAL